MALQTSTTIYIADKRLDSYQNLRLIQEIDAHHDLELVCRTDAVEKLSEELIGDSKDYLGSIITIQISANLGLPNYRELEFKGIITEIKATRGFEEVQGDLVTLIAKSTSILADNINHYTSYTNLGLSDILQQTFQGYDTGKLGTEFEPTSSDSIHYSVQHNESDFAYASRLAAYHNEWFYYNGKKLVFGTPSTDETELIYGVDVKKFGIHLQTIPNNATYFTNDYLINSTHQKSSTEVAIPQEGYHGFIDNKSKETYTKQRQIHHSLYNDNTTKSKLDTQIEQYTKARAIQQIISKGSSDNPGVNLGEVIKINGYGSYRVIKIIHTNTENGVYKNEFEAVDANFDAYPKMDITRFPKSEVQIATVVDNSDPEGLGRIKVQFAWQKPLGESTPWLRMMTPHAGKDKGFHFLPEKNEEVVINFESGNAERPFIAGTLYNGAAKPDSWQTNANDIKAIRSRSGHTIELNDTKNGESITITDKKGNNLVIDTAGETITINALKNINITAGENIQINAGKNIDISAGGNISKSAGEDVSIVANKDMTLNASGNMTEISDNRNDIIDEDYSRQSGTSDEYANEISLFSAEENLTMQSSKTVNINSAEKSKLF
ncbi:type VI secretion system Vgr family protein [Aquimarina sp. I32.4]|uniref:type VI secretion system Vgr family protein n=1 Tax=Aquimarina sp. I32.4 TaxID=2053903 RepID=UPI000CDF2C38|nr:phage baseplate assembly protein V [Aquimarina sp. I32.4]